METRSTVTPAKSRSLSDPPMTAPTSLQPSPTFRKQTRRTSKDDQAVPTTPSSSSTATAFRPPLSAASPLPPRRPDFLGLSLHMPPPAASPLSVQWAGPPLSPQLDERDIYMQSQSLSASPATSLPRHSRGLDFSRASSTLHHSTLAESSPDSSPVIAQRSMAVPPRKMSVGSFMLLDPPHMALAPAWPPPERSAVSSSLGSVNMLASDSDSSDSDGDGDASMAGDEGDDALFTTPHVHKLQNPSLPTPLPAHALHTPGGSGSAATPWGATATFSPAQASLMKTIRRTRLQNKQSKRSRKSSSSASNSGYSSMASPRTTSPPPLRSIEVATGTGNPTASAAGYFAWATAARSRRESLALGTDGLHLSSGNDSGDEASANDRNAPTTPGVVRRPVTRRGNLLPKTKGFARIRAQLMEEAAPVDTEMRRERDTIHQVRERDNSVVTEQQLDLASRPGTATGTAPSSPTLLAAVPESAQEDFFGPPELGNDATPSGSRGLGMLNFAAHASRHSGGREYWARFDTSSGVRRSTPPPPPPAFARHASSVVSDTSMDSPAGSLPNHSNSISGGAGDVYSTWRRPRARSSASEASEALFGGGATTTGGNYSSNSGSGMNDDVAIKKFKRRREDDFDIATIKRRAVSPGMMGSGSAQNSPVLTQSSPSAAGLWGLPPPSSSSERKEKCVGDTSGSQIVGSGVRSNSGGSTGHGGVIGQQGKKLGLQGMVDTNDGLMKMSIE